MWRLVLRRAYAFLIISAIALHGFTAVTAFKMAGPGFAQYVAALAAFWVPGIAQIVVAYYAWQQTGSRVNEYSIWILLWLLFAAVVALFASIERRRNLR
jgi:hypothetical protein